MSLGSGLTQEFSHTSEKFLSNKESGTNLPAFGKSHTNPYRLIQCIPFPKR